MKVLADSVLNEDSLPGLQSCYVFTGREREREREKERENLNLNFSLPLLTRTPVLFNQGPNHIRSFNLTYFSEGSIFKYSIIETLSLNI